MTPEVRAEMEGRADRCVRRGEFAEAIDLYEALLSAHPGDEALARKLATLRDSLEPNELLARRPPASEPRPDLLPPAGPEAEGERLFALGDFVGAAAAYRRALRDRPDSQLILERLQELYRLAQLANPRPSPTEQALPADPEGRLRALLDRISSRRRVTVG